MNSTGRNFELEVDAGRRQFETRGVQKVRHNAIFLVRLQKKRFETFTFYGEENVGGNFKKTPF